MSTQMNRELDPIYETALLLYYSFDIEKYKNEIIAQMKDAGRAGEEIYQKNFKTIDKYLQAFSKNRVINNRDSFYFQEVSIDFYLSFVTPFFIQRDFMNSVKDMKDEQVLELIIKSSDAILEQDVSEFKNMSVTEFQKSENIMSFINKFGINEAEKWKMLLIFQKPQEYYSFFSDLLKNNIPAFEKSLGIIKASYDKELQQYNRTFQNGDKDLKLLSEYNLTNCEINVIYPAMITATSVVVLPKACYYGLQAEKAIKDIGLTKDSRQHLLSFLKAISDSSKLEILSTLKSSPKYAAELATQLGLTPATVSHHMSTLLIAKLVYVEKSNGKYYYHNNTEVIKDLLGQLGNLMI